MAVFTSFVFVFAVFATVTTTNALPIWEHHGQVQRRSPESQKDRITMGFGIAIAIIVIATLVFYLGLRRGQTGTWLWWRTRASESLPKPTRSLESYSRSASLNSAKLSRSKSNQSISTISISTPEPVHISTFPIVSPVQEDFPRDRQSSQHQPESVPRVHARPTVFTHKVYELRDSVPTMPPSIAKPTKSSERMRNTYLLARSTQDMRRSRYLSVRRPNVPKTTNPPAKEQSRKVSFDEWRSEYAPSRSGTIVQQPSRTKSPQPWLCENTAVVLDKEVEFAIFELDEDNEMGVGSRPCSRSSQDTLVTPVSPRLLPTGEKEMEWPSPPGSLQYPQPLLIRLRSMIGECDDEWECSSTTDIEECSSSDSDCCSDEESDEEDHDEFEYDVKFDFDIQAIEAGVAQRTESWVKNDFPSGMVAFEEGIDAEDEEKEGVEKDRYHGTVKAQSAKIVGCIEPLKESTDDDISSEHQSHSLSRSEENMDWTGIEWIKRVYTRRQGSDTSFLKVN
ncbi:unnamed protein product [Periconia digitata]|uniref:Uncharacterized protein n=1 Tax=Periconia digitata TaxID=1303443 RepID=A0A9W4UG69_9PLEO|nr:unnamed protein product [Periconia digitata]